MVKKRKNYINKPKKSIKSIFIRLIKIMLFLIILALIIFAGYKFHNSNLTTTKINWTIDSQIKQHEYYYQKLLSESLKNKYLINIAKIKNTLEQQPWIKDATVKRVYWNKLNIKLTAHKISMRWQDNGYISDTGVLFKPRIMINSDAPIAIVNEQEALVFFNDYQNYQNIIKPFIIREFERNQIDKIKINTGAIIILGTQQQKQRLKRFLQVYDKLQNNAKKIKGIFDMRYVKGFALSYQQ